MIFEEINNCDTYYNFFDFKPLTILDFPCKIFGMICNFRENMLWKLSYSENHVPLMDFPL